MISSNSYKLRAGRNRDAAEADTEGANSVESLELEKNEKHGPGRNKAKFGEFKTNQRSGMPGRGAYRGRKTEQNLRSRKCEGGRSDSLGGYRGKFYEQVVMLNLPEDTRISKLLRRLSTETSQEVSLQISKKLLEVLLYPDNAAYVRKAFHILVESMYDILHVSPGPLAKSQAARALGRMGYIMGQEGDFNRYHTWLFSKIGTSYEELQILLMSTFKETLKMETEKAVLSDYIDSLVNSLVGAIEVTENVEVFKAILEVLVRVVEIYPDGFHSQFCDTIDLLFGWHVDPTQTLQNIEFISQCMQKLSAHFKYHFDFSISLIENFMEDISNYTADLPDSVDHVTVLVLALNTVLKCLGPSFRSNSISADFILDCLNCVIKTATKLDLSEDLLIASNECITLLLTHLDTKSLNLSQSIYQLLELEMGVIDDVKDNTVVSLLVFAAKIVKELSANLPTEVIDKLIGPQSPLLKLRNSPYSDIKNSVICVYQALMSLKNVGLLQEAYKFVLGDLERSYVKLVPTYQATITLNPFDSVVNQGEDPAQAVLFLLRCLTQLSNASSIIVMWALKPSILELVGQQMRPHDSGLTLTAPYLQFGMLYLLYAHCKCYNHFISNSTLVTTQKNRFALSDSDSSPNSGNFQIILDVLFSCLNCDSSVEVTLMLLNWLRDILVYSDSCLEVFYSSFQFTRVVEVLVRCGYSFNHRIAQSVAGNLRILLGNCHLAWSHQFLFSVKALCQLHLTSTNPTLRDQYCQLLAFIPWDISVVDGCKPTRIGVYNSELVNLGLSWLLSGSLDSEMFPEQFKKVMSVFLQENEVNVEVLCDVFTVCWNGGSSQLFDLTLNSMEVLTNWCSIEAARFCVNSKLRTPLGKPNETFTKIETALNELGNDLVISKGRKKRCVPRIRLLLQFVEHLEKCIYNASEGCATITQPNKSVKSFFIANTNTCLEWWSRIRMVVAHVALHCGEHALALRHAQNILKNPSCHDFERVVVFMTCALVKLKEPEALHGLYVWCRQLSKNYPWIKYGSEQASRRFESALEGYQKLCNEKLSTDLHTFLQDRIKECCGGLLEMPDSDRFELNELSSWSVSETFDHTETNLRQLTLNGLEEKKLQNAVTVIRQQIQELQLGGSSELLRCYTILHYVAVALIDRPQTHSVFLVSEGFEDGIRKIDSSVLATVLKWSEYFAQTDATFKVCSSSLRLEVAKRARKERNFTLATRHLISFFTDHNIHLTHLSDINQLEFPEHTTTEMARAFTEVVKLLYCNQDTRHLALEQSSVWAPQILKGDNPEIASKLLLKLAGWIPSCDHHHLTEFTETLPPLSLGTCNVIPDTDLLVGRLVWFSANHCPGLAKSWYQFGNWCYRWGKKVIEHQSSFQNCLSEEICQEVRTWLPPASSQEIFQQVLQVLTLKPAGFDDLDSSEVNSTETIQTRLQTVLPQATANQLNSLVEIWKKSHQNIYKLYSLSADSYFKYLNLTSTQELKECTTVTVTLRLLRLIVKYALELQGILDEGLQTTPTGPWKVIIPQLFSRLNHPESYVRIRLSELLCRVSQDAPLLIIFPAVIGALDEGLKFDLLPRDSLLEDLEENADSDTEDGAKKKTLQKSFQNLVEKLTSNQNQDFITQVEVLVKELRRITLLWEELWLGTLGQLQTEIGKRQRQLETEIAKVQNNPHLTTDQKANLTTEKHRIITKPLIVLLEQLELVTSSKPETPHEANFQLNYSKDIQTVIAGLKQPEDPLKSLKPLKMLYKKFQQQFQKKTLQTKDISPILHSFQNTLIAMPGLDSKLKVAISKVGDLVQVLPTKTRPKKLVFYGSDGQTYTYLFKGLEDLHLDERIMQFLSIANTMMAQNADPAGRNLYTARHYSVIPLGPRSGLISWVDGTTPVFALYKRWQQRELSKPGNTKNVGTVPRPSELFYNKLMEHGVKNMENRKEWPLAVLKDVLTELMAETPADLIAKELWCNAVSANRWWQVVKRYSYSVAVMSIIGYIIGLGDRHLDNVLIDLQTGDVVHIDYNVCFEKGKTLRVPEKVPFRLTPNIREALGVTGVEGIFRLACENVLKTMRKGRETLLTLLEAFVYDPLIDWTVGGEVLAGTTFAAINPGDQNKLQTEKELECEVTLAMFDVRCTEMEVEWSENKENVLNEIPALVEQLNLCLELSSGIEEVEDQLQDLHQQLALVKEAEAQGPKQHSLYKLPMLYDAYVKSQEAVNKAKKGLYDILKDCEQHLNIYRQLQTSFESQQFVQWVNELKFNLIEDKVFDLIRDFLHKAGKDDLVSECEASELDVTVLAQNLNLNTRKCIQTFQDYFALLAQCPKSYAEAHRVILYAKWANYLLETRNMEGCDLVLEEFKNFLESATHNGEEIVKTAYALDNHYKDTLVQVNRFYELAIKSREEAVTLETTYNQAKKNLEGFLGQEPNAQKALKFVLAGELLLLNRMLLTSEITAQKSGNWLIKLTSREGDWFLDDLVLYSFRAVEIVNNIPLKSEDDPRLFQIINGIRTANAVYKGLYDLNFNFHTIILPETMKKVQSDEDSVRAMIAELDRVIGESELEIPDILAGLEKLLTCVLMHVDVHTTCDYLLDKVATVKTRFLDLITTQSDSGLSQGKMLLMGFNGLFEKINQEINNLVSSLGSLDLPKSWKKLDHVKEAKNIAPHIFNHQIKTILESIFFLKKILAIAEFFALSKQMCQGVRRNVPTLIYSDEVLTKPIKQFTAEFVARLLLGVTPEIITYVICLLLQQLDVDVTHEIEQKDIGAESKVPLDELYQKGYSLLLKEGAFSASVVSQASGLETSLKLAWEKIQEPKKVEQKLALMQSSAFRLQTQLAVHSMMFDDVLALSHVPTARVKFVQEMRSELVSLQTSFKQLKEAQEKQQKLIDKAYQRLNWAKGVNPNVGDILAAFETAVSARDTQLNLEQKIAASILHSYNSMLQHELLRMSGSDATKTYDQLFLKCYDQWRHACQYDETKLDSLQPAERSILGMLSLELIQNPKWLHQVALHITDVIGLYQKRLREKKEDLFVANDRLTSCVNSFKAVYAVHTRLMEDVKGLVKAMTKMEDRGAAAQEFARKYREYGERFVGLFGGFVDRRLDKALIEEMLAHLEYIQEVTVDIYEGLLSLQGRLHNSDEERQSLPQRQTSSKSRTESKVQLRNAYALDVWRRVKMKLEGRDPDPGSKSTVPEQVDYVIREATSLNNLALLYEGWTPWV